METIKELRVHLERIGIVFANCNSKEKQLAIIKNCILVTSLVSAFISTGWFRLFSAQSTRGKTESIF